MLEIARQSVPDGYGNSYFWVKPPRIVPADRVRTVGGRLDYRGERGAAVRRGRRGPGRPRGSATRGITTIGVCFLHSYANPAHELRMREVLAGSTRTRSCRCRSEVLREYREYERAMTTLVDAAVKPRMAALRRRHHRAAARASPAPRPAGCRSTS